MKSLFIFSMLFGSLVFATTQERIIASIAPVDMKIKSVQLSQSGLVYIQKANGTYKHVQLTAENLQDLSGSVEMLEQAEVTTDKRLVVCMMMLPAFAMQNLSVYDSQSDSMKLVLTTNSCAVSSYTHPKEDYNVTRAQTLKAQLIVLARQFAQD